LLVKHGGQHSTHPVKVINVAHGIHLFYKVETEKKRSSLDVRDSPNILKKKRNPKKIYFHTLRQPIFFGKIKK
jgi:hypothetical protein